MKFSNFKFNFIAALILCAAFSLLSCAEYQGSSVDNSIALSYKTPVPMEESAPLTGSALIQLALLLDTSNSMDGLINQAKSQLWKIVNELAKAKYNGDPVKLEIALYEYGNDKLPGKEGYIRQVTPLIGDLDKISEELFALTTLGGNEFCGQVIQSSLDQLEWNENPEILKMVYIAGNEPFTQGTVDYKEVCKRAKNEHVVINTIFCGQHEEGIETQWKDGALFGDGEYLSIQQDDATVYVQSPFDPRITELNIQLNQTYVAYGERGGYYKMNQSRQDANAGSYDQANYVERSISKSKSVYNNSEWDLIDKSAEEGFDAADLKEKDLPSELKGKSEEEIEEFIDEKKAERDAINKEIEELAAKRAEYIEKEKGNLGQDNSLENAMLKALKKKAIELNYTFE